LESPRIPAAEYLGRRRRARARGGSARRGVRRPSGLRRRKRTDGQGPPKSTRDESRAYQRRERIGGEFSRVVTLPVEIDADKIEATLRDGVLSLKLPKAETTKPRQITVKSTQE